MNKDFNKWNALKVLTLTKETDPLRGPRVPFGNFSNKTLVFTGGHHTGALEVAKELKNKGWKIVWLGHRFSMWGDASDSAEYKEVKEAGIEFHELLAGKFHRTYNPLKLIRIPWGFVQALYYLIKFKPTGIISFGGYLAVPVVIGGWFLRVSAITHEQATEPGLANRLISLFAKKILVTWQGNLGRYPFEKTELVGLPLPPGIVEAVKNPTPETRRRKQRLFITGGKQGAVVINRIIFEALPELLKKYTVLHQTGNNTEYGDYQTAKKIKAIGYQCVDFLSSNRFSKSLLEADIVVSRSGAHICYELAVLGKKSVLIPLPWASRNEQTKNAEILERKKLAIIISQDQLTVKSLLLALEYAEVLDGKPMELQIDSMQRMVGVIEKTYA